MQTPGASVGRTTSSTSLTPLRASTIGSPRLPSRLRSKAPKKDADDSAHVRDNLLTLSGVILVSGLSARKSAIGPRTSLLTRSMNFNLY